MPHLSNTKKSTGERNITLDDIEIEARKSHRELKEHLGRVARYFARESSAVALQTRVEAPYIHVGVGCTYRRDYFRRNKFYKS